LQELKKRWQSYGNWWKSAVCVGIGDTIKEARDRAYLLSSEISFDGKKFRTDIAYQALKN
jgi:phosphoribosylamine--glycine ligase